MNLEKGRKEEGQVLGTMSVKGLLMGYPGGKGRGCWGRGGWCSGAGVRGWEGKGNAYAFEIVNKGGS